MPISLRYPEFLRSLLAAAVVPLAVLALAAAPVHARAADAADATATAVVARAPAFKATPTPGPLADFGGKRVSAGLREVANWAFFTRDNQGHSVVILDKQAATVYAFTPEGKLFASAPALVGLTVGDDTAPGVGDKPLAEVRDDEKTTPAGRFVAEPGADDSGVDIVWIDYDAGVAMHRVINKVRAERRPERLASPRAEDRRISFGCINLPVTFYDDVVSPMVKQYGAIIYVLPETRSPQQVFGAFDVPAPGVALQQVAYQKAR